MEKVDASIYTLKIKKAYKDTEDSVIIQFEPPEEEQFSYLPGQYLTLVIDIDGVEHRRNYSLCSSPYTDDYLAVGVKRLENGLISNYLIDNAESLSELRVMKPMGKFTFEPGKKEKRHVVLLGAGSGITPLMSILKSALSEEPKTKVTLVYGNRNQQSIMFKQELDELQQDYADRLTVTNVLSKPEDDWVGLEGRVNKDMTLRLVEQHVVKPDAKNMLYYLCGPEGMKDEVRAALQILGINKKKIHEESFVVSSVNQKSGVASGDDGQQTITIKLDGEEHQIEMDAGTTILEAALDEGLNMPFSCQSGICTTCMGFKESGEVEMDTNEGLDDEEVQEGYVLTCQSHPKSSDVVINMDDI